MNKEIEEKLKEYRQLAGNTDPQSEARKEELLKWFDEHQSPELKEKGEKMMGIWLEDLKEDIEDLKRKALRKEMDEKVYKLTPWGYIAKEYFGKSAAWLSQRINGTPVRGQVYTLNAEQKETLNRALSEVGALIGSYRFT
ncbi:MAG: DUF5053 domain-containing protein [Prevotella sp.]|nr:DUF5053 domain-containing protein [Prevotella sp.]